MGQQNVLLSKSGFSLVEVMIALVIALLVFFALMQTALVGIDSNMRNALRDTAVNVADMRMDEARSIPFTQSVDYLVSDTGSLSGAACPAGFYATGKRIQRDVKSVTNFDFCTNMDVVSINADNRQVNITVGWKWKGESYTHRISTLRKKA
jgi:prepilin-type N-terminal cleavage/methylation domain-containing protein